MASKGQSGGIGYGASCAAACILHQHKSCSKHLFPAFIGLFNCTCATSVGYRTMRVPLQIDKIKIDPIASAQNHLPLAPRFPHLGPCFVSQESEVALVQLLPERYKMQLHEASFGSSWVCDVRCGCPCPFFVRFFNRLGKCKQVRSPVLVSFAQFR